MRIILTAYDDDAEAVDDAWESADVENEYVGDPVPVWVRLRVSSLFSPVGWIKLVLVRPDRTLLGICFPATIGPTIKATKTMSRTK